MTKNRPLSRQLWSWSPLVALILVLAACASLPPPTDALEQAAAAVEAAGAAGADDHAPLELGFALRNLGAAQSASAQKDYATAADLAAEAQADADLARVKAELAGQRQRNDELDAENRAMRERLVRDGWIEPDGAEATP